jgi:hypothetical protein
MHFHFGTSSSSLLAVRQSQYLLMNTNTHMRLSNFHHLLLLSSTPNSRNNSSNATILIPNLILNPLNSMANCNLVCPPLEKYPRFKPGQLSHCLRSYIFQSCIFVRHFQVLHFQRPHQKHGNDLILIRPSVLLTTFSDAGGAEMVHIIVTYCQ